MDGKIRKMSLLPSLSSTHSVQNSEKGSYTQYQVERYRSGSSPCVNLTAERKKANRTAFLPSTRLEMKQGRCNIRNTKQRTDGERTITTHTRVWTGNPALTHWKPPTRESCSIESLSSTVVLISVKTSCSFEAVTMKICWSYQNGDERLMLTVV